MKQEYSALSSSEGDEEQAKGESSFSNNSLLDGMMTFRLAMTLALVVFAALFGYFLGYDRQTYTQSHHDAIHQLRYDAALASFRILQNDTLEAAAESYFVDIGPLADVVDKALDTVGFRRVFLELFETHSYTLATMKAAKALGANEFRTVTFHEANARPSNLYSGIPSNRWTNKATKACTACLPALHHWVGAIAADKFLQDGTLLLDATTRERLSTPRDVIAELQRMTMEEEPPDMVPFHSQHGFLWTYIPAVVPTLFDSFPSDLAMQICTDLLWEGLDNRTMSVIPGLDVIRECRHGFGHAVFYELSNRQLGVPREQFSARRQFRTHAGFVLTDENICEAVRICNETPGLKTYHNCVYGARHAYYEVSFGRNMSAHGKEVMDDDCGFEKINPE